MPDPIFCRQWETAVERMATVAPGVARAGGPVLVSVFHKMATLNSLNMVKAPGFPEAFSVCGKEKGQELLFLFIKFKKASRPFFLDCFEKF